MSYPRHPKGDEICRLLLEMRSVKEICAAMKVKPTTVRNQIDRLGLIRIGLTREERKLIAERRGIPTKLVP
jgi:hypothetical protein